MGVVVLSISYRLGVFGFMAYPELAAESKNNSGNYGLLDQLAALKWIQKNIHAFGGNPARVTIFGESSGGASVSMLCASHLAKGLFSGVICESGGNFKPTEGTGIKTLKSAEKIGIEFVNKMGVTSIAELRKINPEKWVKDPFTYMDGNFEPFIDGYVITDDQYRLYRNGKYNDVDVIVGTNSDEGGTFSFMNKIKQADYKTTIESTYGPFADKFLKLYSGNTEEQVKTSMSDILRDKNYAWGSWTWVRLQKKTGKGNVFLYYFDQQQPATMMGTVLRGAGHGNEIPYVFKSLDPKKKSEDDLKLSEQMAQYWVNFAKTRNPNGKGLPEWPVFNEDKNTVMYLHVNPEVGPVPNLEKLQLFEEYFNWVRK
jgi:para-nitrobenzyl esterase